MNAWADYDGSAHKLLTDNRDAYIAQSAQTRDGKIASFAEAKRKRDESANAPDELPPAA